MKEIIVPVKFDEHTIKLVNDSDCFETFCMSISCMKEIIVPVKFDEHTIKLVNDSDCFETFCMSIKGCDCNCPFWFHDCCGDTYEAFKKELEK